MMDTISCQDARRLLSDGAVLVDVRQPHEFEQGALPEAINVPLTNLPMAFDQFKRGTRFVLYCNTGRRSAHAKRVMQAMGVEQVHDLGSFRKYFNCQ